MVIEQIDSMKMKHKMETIEKMCIKVLDQTNLYDCMSKCLAEEIIRYLNS